ncbi:MAG: bifunctional demethylmenaquinone methyltransferase/2-methoxy-6-polyprenyl-1,4-benzoquinol methylase UbiE [Helicobacteraceae bacterium]|jgi:demethylmenaquinone methyltransferase/2-methoxy-6-polyprenyl-1,4-benzoquinol methylase|nr:bifunctional demethylmenaquinone methyltransferase/2-methoxy-6-polyprenyl-1,4-benzoquinol methylase UbiE [Helicobacteraceae bacterium]
MSKQKQIINMFDEISPTYDRLNRVLSFGADRAWRRNGCLAAFRAFLGGREQRDHKARLLVDVATGTGDLIFFWRAAAKKARVEIKRVIGVDPAKKMLEIAEKKIGKDAEFIVSEAVKIPLEDNSVDLISISYGIRNVVEIDKAIKEFYRLLDCGGILLILEFMSREKLTIFDRFARLYMKRVLPAIGKLISKDDLAYKYLPESIEKFLTKEELETKLQNAGFEIVQIKDETFKISTRFIARKPM